MTKLYTIPETDPIPFENVLLGDASMASPLIAQDVEARTAVAADPAQSLETRLEAYEDLIDSEVGDTTLARARNLERAFGLRQIYLKFEGGNPTGTQKDRIAFTQALDALRRGFDAITVATCGNYGSALAIAAAHAGIKAYIYIPKSYRTRRIAEMAAQGAEIIRTDGSYEEAVIISRAKAEADEIYDANPGGANTALQLSAYGGIAYEIYDELRDAPAVVSVSVSNGTTLAGIYKGFVSLFRRGKTSRIPRIVAGSAYRKNPIVTGCLSNASVCSDLRPESIRETSVNEPLVNWHSVDGDLALDAIRSTNGFARHVSDKNMTSLSRMVRELEGLNVLPAATAGLFAMLDHHRNHPLPGDRYVAVLTGRRL
jgi:threonine synthase